MMYEKGMKLRIELIFIDEVVYGVEPCNYYDDGVRHIYKFIDDEGNLFVWKTSKSLCVESKENGEERVEFVEVGDRVFLYGSIKGFSTYKHEDQILITRCNVMSIEEKHYASEEDIKEFQKKMQLSKLSKDVEIKTVSYRDFKGSYGCYETVVGSFKRTDSGCFIDVIIPKNNFSSIYYFSE